MVFSAPAFLFAFLPAVVVGYFLCPRFARNAFLLLSSLVFHVLGAGFYSIVLAATIVVNHWIALRMPDAEPGRRRALLIVASVANLLPLALFKYAAFATAIANQALGWSGAPLFTVPQLFLPAGISFFALQGTSYVVDVYRGESPPCRSLRDFALYKSFFPQLIAGPIVRYHEIARQLSERTHSLAQVEEGLARFGFGLGKKVLLADTLGRVADQVFATGGGSLGAGTAWLGLLCYTFQIFFDFSGYSDMAIGLGRVFGLTLPENFRQPYRSHSVTEFWRRWHVTLSTWFRDYVYVPLGGNRRGAARTAVNLGLVFLACGLWHGAAWTFVAWGLYHGSLLALERVAGRRGFVTRGLAGQALTFTLVMLGWVFFRSPSLAAAVSYFGALAGLTAAPDPLFTPAYYLTANHVTALAAASLLALWPDEPQVRPALLPLRSLAALTVTALALVAQSPKSFNPFIYFQF